MSYEDSQEFLYELAGLFPEMRASDVHIIHNATKTVTFNRYLTKLESYRFKKYGQGWKDYYFNQQFIKDNLENDNKNVIGLLAREAVSEEILVYLKIKGAN